MFQREAVLPTRHGAETVLCAMPLFHSYGMAMGLFLAASAAATLVVLPRYRPDDVFDAVARERVTLFPGSPTIYAGLMAHARFAQTDWSSVRVCYSGSAPLAEETLRRWEAAVGAPIYEGYGQTEAGPILTYNGPQGSRAGSVGRPVPGTEVEVVDLETGAKPLLAGQRGEIARGPQIMQGYLARPEATAESLRDGWLYTGDIGEFAEDGFLYIRDRKKDLVIVGGYNVYPREVDEVLYLHADVAQAAAVGWPDSYRGEVIRAFVVLRPDASADEAALLAHCQANLARYKGASGDRDPGRAALHQRQQGRQEGAARPRLIPPQARRPACATYSRAISAATRASSRAQRISASGAMRSIGKLQARLPTSAPSSGNRMGTATPPSPARSARG